MATAHDGFAGLGLVDELSRAVAALGYEEATPVQREAIPLLIAKRDLLAQAATGTGKTAAFALPMLQQLAEHEAGAASRRHVGGLVLVPTRELSMQVAEAIHKYAKGLGIRVAAVYGGASMQQQIRALEHRARPPRAGPARRDGTTTARPCHAAVPRRPSRPARPPRRRGARPRHRAPLARGQLRRAVGGGGLCAPDRPEGSRRTRRHRHYA